MKHSNNYLCDERPNQPNMETVVSFPLFTVTVFCRIRDNHTKVFTSVGLTQARSNNLTYTELCTFQIVMGHNIYTFSM